MCVYIYIYICVCIYTHIYIYYEKGIYIYLHVVNPIKITSSPANSCRSLNLRYDRPDSGQKLGSVTQFLTVAESALPNANSDHCMILQRKKKLRRF